MAGNYQNPGWINGGSPALEKSNLDAMSNAIVQNQSDIAALETLTENYESTEEQTAANTQTIENLKSHLLVVTNTSVAASAWASNSTYSSAGFGFRAKITVANATATHVAFVNFSPNDAVSGNFAPFALATSGGVYVYAAVKPTAATPIPSVVCLKQTT